MGVDTTRHSSSQTVTAVMVADRHCSRIAFADARGASLAWKLKAEALGDSDTSHTSKITTPLAEPRWRGAASTFFCRARTIVPGCLPFNAGAQPLVCHAAAAAVCDRRARSPFQTSRRTIPDARRPRHSEERRGRHVPYTGNREKMCVVMRLLSHFQPRRVYSRTPLRR